MFVIQTYKCIANVHHCFEICVYCSGATHWSTKCVQRLITLTIFHRFLRHKRIIIAIYLLVLLLML